MSNFFRDAEAEIEVARAQFQPISEEEFEYLEEITGADAAPEEVVFEDEDHEITRGHIRAARSHNAAISNGISADIVRAYFFHICQRAAVGRARTRAAAQAPSPTCTVLPENFQWRMQMSGGPNSPATAAELTAAGCKGGAMLNFDYIFMPHFWINHWVLLGVAPKQRFVFLIDSMFQADPRWNREVQDIADLVWQEVNIPAPMRDEWLLITPSYNNMDTVWQNRISVRQKDSFSCSSLTCTNGLCLAFGYPLLCYSNEAGDGDDMPRKRERIALELLSGGFNPPYDYQVLNVPQERMLFRTQSDEPRIYEGFEFPPNCQQPVAIQPPARTLTTGWMTGQRRRVGGPGRRRGRLAQAGAGGMPEREDSPQLYVSNEKPGANFSQYPVYEGAAWPRQFSKRFFQARILFAGSKGPFDGKSKKQLVAICKKDREKFKEFQKASRKTIPEFRRWMETVIEQQSK